MISALRKIRRGELDREVEEFVSSCERELPDGEIKPTALYARNRDVDAVNAAELAALPGPQRFFDAKDSVLPAPDAPRWAGDQLRREAFFTDGTAAPRRVALKIGAQVDEKRARQIKNR